MENLGTISVFVILSILVGGLFGAFVFPNNTETEVEVEVIKEIEVLVEVPVEGINDGQLELVNQYIYDNDGLLESIIDDLDSPTDIPSRVEFLNTIKDLCVNGVKDELFDELDNYEYNENVTLDDKELTRLRVDDDSDELDVTVTDWEDLEGTVEVTGTFKQDLSYFNFTVDAVFEDGEFDKLDNLVVVLQQ